MHDGPLPGGRLTASPGAIGTAGLRSCRLGQPLRYRRQPPRGRSEDMKVKYKETARGGLAVNAIEC
ncbi:hypothetical protein GCM10009801_12960 [Streptomyces albiaxialis]|uniref:Uncharacterized protein n=1 Tax=Streptomyces albiaxialis TaxID=329523 RepID=A0ABN2VPM2_9ACTN